MSDSFFVIRKGVVLAYFCFSVTIHLQRALSFSSGFIHQFLCKVKVNKGSWEFRTFNNCLQNLKTRRFESICDCPGM